MYHNYRESCTCGLACGVLAVPPARAWLPGNTLIQGECCKFLPLCLQFDNKVLPDFSGWARAPVAKQPSSSCSPFHPPPPATAFPTAFPTATAFLSAVPSPCRASVFRIHQPTPQSLQSQFILPPARVAHYPSRHLLPLASPTTVRVTYYRSRHLEWELLFFGLFSAELTVFAAIFARSPFLLPPARVNYHPWITEAHLHLPNSVLR
jgi:hypothetical protein